MEEEKKLVVLFPGRNYSCDKPLLYYAGQVFRTRGYDVIRLNYNTILKGDKENVEGLIDEAWPYVRDQLAKVDFSAYRDIVFVSKSMGTTLAGRAEEHFNIIVRHIFLTPIKSALKYMRTGRCIVIAGKNDKMLEERRLRIYAAQENIALKQFDDVGHSLECFDDISVTFAILMVIVRMYNEF